MSDLRRFLKGLTSLPLATVLANPRLAAAVSAGLQEIDAKLLDGRTIKDALAEPQRQDEDRDVSTLFQTCFAQTFHEVIHV